MSHIFNNIRIPDNKTILDNLDEFKIMLETQKLYCYDMQTELSRLNESYTKRDNKYKKLKYEYKQIVQINQEQKNEISNLKLQLEFLNKMIIHPVNYVNQHNYLQMNTNTQIQIPIPPPPPPPPLTIKLTNNNKQNSIMNEMIKELKSKIKPIDI